MDDLNGQLTQGGEPITFSIDGAGNLIGQVNGTGPAVITIAFIGAVNGPGGTVTYSYQVTLGGPVDHDPGDQIEGIATLENIQVQVTDSNGDSESESFTGTIFDDVPSVDSDLATEVSVTVDESLPSTDPAIDTLAVVKGNDPDLAGGIAIGSANSGSAVVDANAVFGADGPAAGGGIS